MDYAALVRNKYSNGDKPIFRFDEEATSDISASVGHGKPAVGPMSSDFRAYLDDNSGKFQRQIQSYHDAQERQSHLVHKLQAKVLEYKKKCCELEVKVNLLEEEKSSFIKRGPSTTPYKSPFSHLNGDKEDDFDKEFILMKLDEEEQKNATLSQLNVILQEQLDQATSANREFSTMLDRTRDEMQRQRRDYEIQKSQWRDQERSLTRHRSSCQTRIHELQRTVIELRSSLQAIHTANEKTVKNMNVKMEQWKQNMVAACQNLSVNLKNSQNESQKQSSKEMEQLRKQEKILQERIKLLLDQGSRSDTTQKDGDERVKQLMLQVDQLQQEISERDQILSALHRIHTGDHASDESTFNLAVLRSHLVRDVEAMHEALRNIAQVVLRDADSTNSSDDLVWQSDVSSGPPRPSSEQSGRTSRIRSQSPYSHSDEQSLSRESSKSPMRARKRNQYLANSTLVAVQAALEKKTLQIQDLRAKLHSGKDHLSEMKNQLTLSDEDRRVLEQRLNSLKQNMDAIQQTKEELQSELDHIKISLQTVSMERDQLQQTLQNRQQQISELRTDVSRQQQLHSELKSQMEVMEVEKEKLVVINEKLQRELSQEHSRHTCVEEKASKLQEDLTHTRGLSMQSHLEKSLVDMENHELKEALANSETLNATLELEITRIRSALHDVSGELEQKRILVDTLQRDKKDLHQNIMQKEAEMFQLNDQKRALERTMQTLRENMQRMDERILQGEQEKAAQVEQLKQVDLLREQLEKELSQCNQERLALSERVTTLSRQKSTLSDEVLQSRKELDRLLNDMAQMKKWTESLTLDKSELREQFAVTCRDLLHSQEILETCKLEKNNLEASLYETQQQLAEEETQRAQTELRNSQLEQKLEALKDELNQFKKLLEVERDKHQRAAETQEKCTKKLVNEFEQSLKTSRNQWQEEKEQLNASHEETLEQFKCKLQEITTQKDIELKETLKCYAKDKEALTEEIVRIQKERDEALWMTENDRQMVVMSMEIEKDSLQEKLKQVQNSLKNAENELERTQSEAAAKEAYDEEMISELKKEVKVLRKQLNDVGHEHQRALKDLNYQLDEMKALRGEALKEIDENKTQIQLAEESRERIREDAMALQRRLQDVEEQRDKFAREIMEVKRQLVEEQGDNTTLQISLEEWRRKFQDKECEKIELQQRVHQEKQRAANLEEQAAKLTSEGMELRKKLMEMEKDNVEVARQIQAHERYLREVDSMKKNWQKESEELESMIKQLEEKEEHTRQEMFKLKQRLVESETTNELYKRELSNAQRHLTEAENEINSKDREISSIKEEANTVYHQVMKEKLQLEAMHEINQAERNKLKEGLCHAEGRVRAMESRLLQLEEAYKQCVNKLTALQSVVRPFVVQMKKCGNLTVNEPQDAAQVRDVAQLTASSRSRESSTDTGILSASEMDVTPEKVRIALRELKQQLLDSQREREKCLSQFNQVSEHLKDCQEEQAEVEKRFQALQETHWALEEEFKSLKSQLDSTQRALLHQEDTLQRLEREGKLDSASRSKMELYTASLATEKQQLENKVNKCLEVCERLEMEKKQLRRALEEVENSQSQVQIVKRNLDNEIERCKNLLADKDKEIQGLVDQVQRTTLQLKDVENKAQTLQLTVDRQNTNIMKSESEINTLKDDIMNLSLRLKEKDGIIEDLKENESQLTKSYHKEQQSCKVLQVQADTLREALANARQQNQQLLDRTEQLQQEVRDQALQIAESDSTKRNVEKMLLKQESSDKELHQTVKNLLSDNSKLNEDLRSTQKSLKEEQCNREILSQQKDRLAQEIAGLRLNLEKAEKERLFNETTLNRASMDRNELLAAIQQLQDENKKIHKELDDVHAKLSDAETGYAQIYTRTLAEHKLQLESLRSEQLQAMKARDNQLLILQEKIKSLENQNANLRENLIREVTKRRQSELASPSSPSSPLRMTEGKHASELNLSPSAAGISLDHSNMKTVLEAMRDPYLESLLLETSTRRPAEDAVGDLFPTRLPPSPHRSPMRLTTSARSSPMISRATFNRPSMM